MTGDVQLDADFLLEGFASQAVVDEGLQHVALGGGVGFDVGFETLGDDFACVTGND